MAASYNFKQIGPVPTAAAFIDIVLNKTQRQTPTVVHRGVRSSPVSWSCVLECHRRKPT